ncbi:MAG: Cu(I)-responsive transcriptional regulator [Alphaproteobacteria bacterium]|nr:Cu(I)-responsive transcriptional regulator [Alphaproteobacteria bacterium]MBT4085742.1 Cu(I)-responsive transcriptional regulator [Alphaproteobacteria bacterium]MBT4543321.1 Cu(I)-responsive transcriptional regulator [Alphaproteobacteria bacterium]MBT7747190.1 Cu(I)-responsive transcriptional regulator [Alphaproteobacteria bacterium]
MNIGEAASLSGVAPKNIRYYESIGLIGPAKRAANGYRAYDETDVRLLGFVNRARSLGFSVKEVSGLLSLYQDRARASSDVKKLALEHIEDIDRKVEELQSMRRTLKDLTDRCHGDDRPDCPILDDLSAGVTGARQTIQAAE